MPLSKSRLFKNVPTGKNQSTTKLYGINSHATESGFVTPVFAAKLAKESVMRYSMTPIEVHSILRTPENFGEEKLVGDVSTDK
jgi:hypothetical protein